MNTSDLDIPEARPGWAKSPAKVVADPAWRRPEKRRLSSLVWLAGLAGLSLVGAAVLVLLGREPAAPAEAPLITADSSPVRVRPDDPGGMRVPNLDERVYDQLSRAAAPQRAGGQTGGRVESLLPPPEAPKPLPVPPEPTVQSAALTEGPSQAQAAREPEQPLPAPAQLGQVLPPPPPSATQTLAPAAPPPAPAAAAPAPPPAPPAPRPSGSVQVQLAAVPSEQAANAEWNRLRRRMPELLADQRLVISRGQREGGQPFFRIRTGAFADNASARAFCEQIKTRGGSCFVAPAS